MNDEARMTNDWAAVLCAVLAFGIRISSFPSAQPGN
jgi:hypothetical protein